MLTVGDLMHFKETGETNFPGPRRAPKKYWLSTKPDVCDVCDQELKVVFFDAKTKMGPWGILCKDCFERVGIGLGLGLGQKYDLTTLEKLEG